MGFQPVVQRIQRCARRRHFYKGVCTVLGLNIDATAAVGNNADGITKIERIQNGEYAKMFILEGKTNYPAMTARRRLTAEHQIETVGAKLRDMMPWIKKNKLVDQSKN